MNTKISPVISVLIAILFMTALAGTVSYYNSELNDRNSKISSLKSQVVNLNSEIANLTNHFSNLTAEVTNLTSATLVTALGINEASNTPSIQRSYHRLYIEGSVTNTGRRTAFNAGIHVVAYPAYGPLEIINMTVPLGTGDFGTNSEIESYVLSFDPVFTKLKFGSLVSGQTANVHLNIYHEGTVSNWTITPVSTNSP